jgi:hypothetical protein
VALCALSQAQKVDLARALLASPDVLLLQRVGDSWSTREQLGLALLLRDFLSGALDEHLPQTTRKSHGQPHAQAGPARGRCVVATMNEGALAVLLGEPTDLVLTVESAERATLRERADMAQLGRLADTEQRCERQHDAVHRELSQIRRASVAATQPARHSVR